MHCIALHCIALHTNRLPNLMHRLAKLRQKQSLGSLALTETVFRAGLAYPSAWAQHHRGRDECIPMAGPPNCSTGNQETARPHSSTRSQVTSVLTTPGLSSYINHLYLVQCQSLHYRLVQYHCLGGNRGVSGGAGAAYSWSMHCTNCTHCLYPCLLLRLAAAIDIPFSKKPKPPLSYS